MKHKRIIAALLLLGLFLAFCLAGCDEDTAVRWDTPLKTEYRFICERYDIGVTNAACVVITDTETGVQYLYYKGGYGGGLTKLEGGQ